MLAKKRLSIRPKCSNTYRGELELLFYLEDGAGLAAPAVAPVGGGGGEPELRL